MTEQTRKAMTSSAGDSWNTPQWFVELVWQFDDIALDPCSNEGSIVGARFRFAAGAHGSHRLRDDYIGNDGLPQNWKRLAGRGLVYVNPPYGRGVIGEWLRKCDEEAAKGTEIIALVPARVDALWYQGCRRNADVEILGRLTFGGAHHPALFPSSVFYWGKRVERFAEVFGPLGRLHVVEQSKTPARLRSVAARRVLQPEVAKQAALYHRVSTVDQDQAGARLELRRAAAARGLVVAFEVEETGSGAQNDRPGLLRVMEAAKRGKVGAVVVWKLDRFGRSALDLLTNLKELELAGVRFIATTQGVDIQAGGDPMSRLIVNTLAAVAEFERTLIAERTAMGLKQALKRGARLGRPPKLGAGEVAALADRVRKLRQKNKTWAAIAAKLGCGLMQARRAAFNADQADAMGAVTS